MHGSQPPLRLLGFTLDEWREAQFDDPAEAAQFQEFLVALREAARGRGGLAGVGPEAILAMARVSPAYARRLRDFYEAADPDWRRTIPHALEVNLGWNDERRAQVRAQWAAIPALLEEGDAAT